MYERSPENDSGLEPDLPKIVALAAALKVTPSYLAFGAGERTPIGLSAVTNGSLARVAQRWTIQDWLTENVGADLTDIELVVLSSYSSDFRPGDLAIVRRSAEPSKVPAEFMFTHNGEARIAPVSRSHGSANIRIFDSEMKYEELPIKKVEMIGRVLGRLGGR